MSNLESYAHKAAKATVCGWLRDAAKSADGGRCGPIYWRVNRSEPSYGIWEEYPVLNDKEHNINSIYSVWDEVLYPENIKGSPIKCEWYDSRPPTLKELQALGYKTKGSLIADIAVQHKGMIIAVIEITHKHELSRKKMHQYIDAGVSFVELDAAWVLSQVEMPASWVALSHSSDLRSDRIKLQKGRIR